MSTALGRSKLSKLNIKWECFFCDATHESKLRCRVVYVHRSDDAVVCQHCDKGPEVTDDIVRRALLVAKLRHQMLEEEDDPNRSAAERAYRKGHNDRNRSLIEALS